MGNRHRRSVEGRGMEHGVYKMDITGTFRKESREFEGGGFVVDQQGVEKIVVLDGRR